MAIERETVIESRPSDTVVVERGSPFRIVGIIVALVIAVLLVLWIVNGGIMSDGDSIAVDLPNVTVTQ